MSAGLSENYERNLNGERFSLVSYPRCCNTTKARRKEVEVEVELAGTGADGTWTP